MGAAEVIVKQRIEFVVDEDLDFFFFEEVAEGDDVVIGGFESAIMLLEYFTIFESDEKVTGRFFDICGDEAFEGAAFFERDGDADFVTCGNVAIN